MRVVVTARRAIDAAQSFDHFPGARFPLRDFAADDGGRHRSQVAFRYTVRFGPERRVANRRAPEGVEVGVKVAKLANGFGQIHGRDNFFKTA